MATRNIDPATGAVAVSAGKQSDYTTAATINRAWPRIDKGVIVAGDPWHILESNRGDVSGGREPDAFYRGNIEPPTFGHTIPQMDADNAAWFLGFFTNNPSAADQKASTGLYKHNGSMAPNTVYEPLLFTECFRRGDETYGADKLLLYAGRLSSLKISANVRDDRFWQISGDAMFTGKYKRNILREGVRHSTQDTSLTLTANQVQGSAGAASLSSIHKIGVDYKGDGRSLTELVASAATAAAPTVITVPKSRGPLTSVFVEESNVLTTMGDGSTAATVTLNTTDYIYFGWDKPFNALYFDIGATPNALAVTGTMEYYNDEAAWTSCADFVDKTLSGGATLAVDGDMFWNLPTDWEMCVLPISNSAADAIDKELCYWTRLKTSGATTTDTTITKVEISRYENADEMWFCDNGSYTDYTTEWNSMDGSEAPAVTITTAQDYVYIGAKKPFSRLYIEIGDTPNAVAATTMTVEDYNGAWAAVAGASDGTSSGAISMAQNGVVSWTQSTDEVTVAPDSSMTEMYYIRLSWDNTLTAGAYIEGIRIGDAYCNTWVTYRGLESTHFTEGVSSVFTETVIPPFIVSQSQFYYGAYWDGTRAHGGIRIKCDMNSFEYSGAWDGAKTERCMDGTTNAFANKHILGSPNQTITVDLDDRDDYFQLLNAYTDENPNNSTTDTVWVMGLAWRSYGPVIKTAYGEERYMIELFWPYTAVKSLSRGAGDGKYTKSVVWEIGQDNDNSYNSLYYRIVNNQSTNYAQ